MKRTTVIMVVLGSILWVSTRAIGQQQVWNGRISDDLCRETHQDMAPRIGYSDHQCVVACVTQSNSTYVLVTEGKVWAIANQDFAGLQEHAAYPVKVTGEQKGNAIVVTDIEKVEAVR